MIKFGECRYLARPEKNHLVGCLSWLETFKTPGTKGTVRMTPFVRMPHSAHRTVAQLVYTSLLVGNQNRTDGCLVPNPWPGLILGVFHIAWIEWILQAFCWIPVNNLLQQLGHFGTFLEMQNGRKSIAIGYQLIGTNWSCDPSCSIPEGRTWFELSETIDVKTIDFTWLFSSPKKCDSNCAKDIPNQPWALASYVLRPSSLRPGAQLWWSYLCGAAAGGLCQGAAGLVWPSGEEEHQLDKKTTFFDGINQKKHQTYSLIIMMGSRDLNNFPLRLVWKVPKLGESWWSLEIFLFNIHLLNFAFKLSYPNNLQTRFNCAFVVHHFPAQQFWLKDAKGVFHELLIPQHFRQKQELDGKAAGDTEVLKRHFWDQCTALIWWISPSGRGLGLMWLQLFHSNGLAAKGGRCHGSNEVEGAGIENWNWSRKPKVEHSPSCRFLQGPSETPMFSQFPTGGFPAPAWLWGTSRLIVRLIDTGDQYAVKPENLRICVGWWEKTTAISKKKQGQTCMVSKPYLMVKSNGFQGHISQPTNPMKDAAPGRLRKRPTSWWAATWRRSKNASALEMVPFKNVVDFAIQFLLLRNISFSLMVLMTVNDCLWLFMIYDCLWWFTMHTWLDDFRIAPQFVQDVSIYNPALQSEEGLRVKGWELNFHPRKRSSLKGLPNTNCSKLSSSYFSVSQ